MSTYRKLTRKKRTIGGSTQLWLGDDHVLMVRSRRFIEEYRRFHLADIQSVIACAAPPKWGLRIGFTLLGVLFFAGLAGSTSMFGRISSAICGMGCLAIAAYDVIRGARCNCRLLTEVTTEPMDPVTRVSDYQRLIVNLQPAIDAVQGTLTPEDQTRLMEGATAPAFVKPQDPPIGAQKYLQHALFAMLLCNAAAYAWGYLWKFEEGLSLAISIIMAEVFFSVMLLWRPTRFGVSGPVKILIGVVAVLVVLDAISGISQASYMIYLAAEQGRLNSKPPVFWDLPWVMLLGKISITWRLLAGTTGLAALWMNREVEPSQPQPQP